MGTWGHARMGYGSWSFLLLVGVNQLLIEAARVHRQAI